MAGRQLPRDPPIQESGRAPFQRRVRVQSAAPRRGSALTLLSNAQATAVPALSILGSTTINIMTLQYAAALSINSELTGSGSAIDAMKRCRPAWSSH